MPAGRPRIVEPGGLSFFAQQFYWDFRGLAEGRFRWGFDNQKFDKTVAELEKMPLSDQDRAQLRDLAEEEVRAGRVQEAQKQHWLREKEQDYLWMARQSQRSIAAEDARIQIKVPGEPDVLKALLRAKTPEQVRQICQDAFARRIVEVEPGDYRPVEVVNWPIPSGSGSMFPRYLSRHAEQFIAAKKNPKFPHSGRPTSLLKQLWFLSRALAGAVLGIQTRTAINLVGSKRPEEVFDESRAGKSERRRASTRVKGSKRS